MTFLSEGDDFEPYRDCFLAMALRKWYFLNGTLQDGCILSIVSLIAGICLVGAGAVYLFLNKGKEKKSAFTWILICVGALLIVNHGIQLIF